MPKTLGPGLLGKTLRFVGGFVLSVTVLPCIVLALMAAAGWIFDAPHGRSGRSAAFQLTASGADLSRAGGASLVVATPRGRVRLACRGACDDLAIRAADPRVTLIEVRDRDGGCVSCRHRWQPWAPREAAWRVAGADRLTISGEAPR